MIFVSGRNIMAVCQNEKLSEIQETANDVYLKANKVEDGVMNYDQVVSLLLGWYVNPPD